MARIKFFALGGQDERGKNCDFLEINDEIYVFNAGIKEPVNESLGINLILPDFSALKPLQTKIKGIFIGYPTFENIGGLPYLLNELDVQPEIFTSEIGKVAIETLFREQEHRHLPTKKPRINVVTPISDLKVGQNFVTAFKVCNTMVSSYGWVIKSPDGAIVYVDDFIVNNDKTKAFSSQLQYLPNITKQKTLALITGTGNAGYQGFTSPNFKNKAFYEGVIQNAPGRVIVACNDHDFYTLWTLATIAKRVQRPFIIYSTMMINVFHALSELRIFPTKGLLSLPVSEMNKTDNAIILFADSQNALFRKLNELVVDQTNYLEDKKSHRLELREGDTFVFGMPVVPGYEGYGAAIIDELAKMNITSYSLPKTILSLQASSEDQKQLISYTRPRYLIPVQGLYKKVVQYEQMIQQGGVKGEQILYVDNGEGLVFENGFLQNQHPKLTLVERYLNQTGNFDVEESILYERKRMSENGILLLTMFFHEKSQTFLKELQFDLVGIVHLDPKTNAEIEEIKDTFWKAFPTTILAKDGRGNVDLKATRLNIQKFAGRCFEKSFHKCPVVLASIIKI